MVARSGSPAGGGCTDQGRRSDGPGDRAGAEQHRGIVARRFLAHGLADDANGIAGIYFSTLPRLAERIGSPALTASGRRPATRPVTAAAIRQRLDADPGIFGPVSNHPSTSRALGTAMTAFAT